MRSQTAARQRPLFHDGPAWWELNKDARQQVVRLFGDMCLEIVKERMSSDEPQNEQEQRNDSGKD
jgi:hypothetical protein